MKWISLVCVLCLLQLASAICECSDGQHSLIPSQFNTHPPSAFNDTDGSPSSFGSTCVEQGRFYQCLNNTDNPLFDCSASNNSYYGWAIDQSVSDQMFAISSTFSNDHRFQSINVSVIFLVSTASNVSVPTEIVYAGYQNSHLVSEVRGYPPANLPEGPYQHNYTLSPGGEFNQVIITIYPNTTFQWVAINKIIFCPATAEVQSSSTPLMSSSSSSLTTDLTVASSVLSGMSSTPTMSATVSPTMPSTMLPTMSATISYTTSPTMSSTMSSTVSPTMSPTVSSINSSTVSPIVSTMSSAVSPTTSSTVSPTMSSAVSSINSSTVSPTQTATGDGTTTDSHGDDKLPLTLLVAVIAIAIFLLIIVLLLAIILCCVCRQSSSDKYSVEVAPTSVPDRYEMFTADTLPSSLSNGVNNPIKSDYDYPQFPLEVENGNHSNHVNEPEYTTPECKQKKPYSKGSSSTMPATFARSSIDIALYEAPSVPAASSKASYNKVIENGEPVYYMLDQQYSFYEKSKSLNAVDDIDIQPYSSIYDDPLPLTKSEAPNYVKPSDIKEIRLLGDGQFGEVYLAEVVGLSASVFEGIDPSNAGPLQVAVKRLRGNPSEEMQRAFEKEIKFMSRLKHKHVIRLLGICTDPNQPFIMIEYAKNGDLNRYLKSLKFAEGNLPPSKKEITILGLLSQCTQIASGMEYLSSLNFIHRDLATRNILVGDWNKVKIADFGMSQNLYNSDYYRLKGHAIVPIRWMATECFYGRFSVKSDVWAFGVVVWEVFTMCSQRPYEELTDAELIQDARNADKRKLLEQTEHCPDQVYQVLLECWKSIPAERLNFTQLHDRFTRLCNGNI